MRTDNENLPPGAVLSYGPHLNGLFNIVGYVDSVRIDPGACQDVGVLQYRV